LYAHAGSLVIKFLVSSGVALKSSRSAAGMEGWGLMLSTPRLDSRLLVYVSKACLQLDKLGRNLTLVDA
jgi:hypothetical protein